MPAGGLASAFKDRVGTVPNVDLELGNGDDPELEVKI